MATQINAEDIKNVLEELTLPSERQSVAEFVSQIIVKDGNVVFAIQALDKYLPEYEKFKKAAEQAILALNGVENVKIAITSHISEAKKQNANREKIEIPGVRQAIVVASGKGGVGKSTVAFNLAAEMAKLGHKVGLVDLDIYGPSLPDLSGIRQKPVIEAGFAIPHEKFNIKLMSVGYLLDDPKQALAWRGPMVTKMLHQLLIQTKWAEEAEMLDYLVIDTPPGTGDVHLSLFEKFKVDSAILVTTPHVLSLADVRKSANLLEKMNVGVSSLINNMAYIEVNGERTYPFGRASKFNSEFKDAESFEIPINEEISKAVEYGLPVSEVNENIHIYQEIAKHINKSG